MPSSMSAPFLEKDLVGTFWMVIYPESEEAELGDVVWETNVIDAMYAAKGGQPPAGIVGIYRSKDAAVRRGQRLLADREDIKPMYERMRLYVRR